MNETVDKDPRFNRELRERAAEFYAGGYSVRQVAIEMELSVRRAWELLTDAEEMGLIKMRPPGRPRQEKK